MLVQDAPYLLGKVCKVSAVKADAVTGGVGIIDAVFLEGADGVLDAAAEGIIGIYKEYQVLSPVGTDIVTECLVLPFHGAAVGSDETVGHCAG